MKIEENKSYRTRGGITVTNLKRVDNGTAYIFEGYITYPESKIKKYASWTKTGAYLANSREHPLDLIEEIN